MAYTDSTEVLAAKVAAQSLLAELRVMANAYDSTKLLVFSMISRLAQLSDAELAAFCNLLGQSHLEALIEALDNHGPALVNYLMEINHIIANASAATLPGSAGAPPASPTVGTTLTAQGRQLVLTGGVYSVAPIP